MKNFLIYIVVSSAISITGGLIYAKYYLSPRVKTFIQTKATEALGVPVQIRDLRVLILPKLSLAASGIKFTLVNPNLKVDINKIFIDAPINKSLFSRTSTFGPIHIRIEEPRINLELKDDMKADATNTQSADENIPQTRIRLSRDVDLDIVVDRAKLKVLKVGTNGEIEREVSADPTHFELKIPGLEKEWSISLKSELNVSHPEVQIPIELVGELGLKDQNLTVSQLTGNLSGISFVVSGQQDFIEKKGQWKLNLDVADFSKVKNPPHLLNLKNWTGAVQADLNAVLSPNSGWQYFGNLKMKNFSADANSNIGDFQLDGPFRIDCDTKFAFFKNLRIERFLMHANLDALQISKPSYFLKPKAVPLSANLSLTTRDEFLNIEDFNLNIFNLKGTAKGKLGLNKEHPSDLALRIDTTNLSGWDKLLIGFTPGTLSGQLNLSSNLRGDLINQWSLDVHSFKLSNMKAKLDYVAPNHLTEAAGPIEVDAELKGLYESEKGLMKSPISINGHSKINFDKLYLHQQKTSSTEEILAPVTTTNSTKPQLSSFEWPRLKDSRFQLSAQVGDLQTNHFNASAVTGVFNIVDQNLTTTLKLNKIASGEIDLNNLNVDLKKEMPDLTGQIELKKVEASEIMKILSTRDDANIKGESSGPISFRASSLGENNWLSQLKANGRITIKNAIVGGQQIDQLLNDKISQIPGIGVSKVVIPHSPVGSEMTLLFTLADSNLNVLEFKIQTPSKNELQAKGNVVLGVESLKLSGTASLADATIGGDVRAANSDPQGRFVIPFSLRGTLKNPEAYLEQKNIEDVLKRTLAYVVKRETDKFKKVSKETLPEKVSLHEKPAPEEPDKTDPPKPGETKVDQLKHRLEGIFNTK